MGSNLLSKPETMLILGKELEIKPLVKLLKASIFSAYLKPDKSFSVIIVAKPQTNKTNTLLKFSEIKNVIIHSDLTYWGMIKEVFPQMKKDNIQTLIILDLLKPLMKGKNTAKNFITVLNCLIEEGIHNLSLGFLNADFEGMHRNLITSITPAVLKDNKRIWNKIGFNSRFIPFSYSYTKEFDKNIKDKINSYDIIECIKEKFDLPMFKQEVNIGKSFCELVNLYAEKLSKQDSKYTTYYKDKMTSHNTDEYSYRHIKQFQCLLKSLALMRGSTNVEDCDLEEFKKIVNYINYDYNLYPLEVK